MQSYKNGTNKNGGITSLRNPSISNYKSRTSAAKWGKSSTQVPRYSNSSIEIKRKNNCTQHSQLWFIKQTTCIKMWKLSRKQTEQAELTLCNKVNNTLKKEWGEGEMSKVQEK